MYQADALELCGPVSSVSTAGIDSRDPCTFFTCLQRPVRRRPALRPAVGAAGGMDPVVVLVVRQQVEAAAAIDPEVRVLVARAGVAVGAIALAAAAPAVQRRVGIGQRPFTVPAAVRPPQPLAIS